jgi:hypothetical protein
MRLQIRSKADFFGNRCRSPIHCSAGSHNRRGVLVRFARRCPSALHLLYWQTRSAGCVDNGSDEGYQSHPHATDHHLGRVGWIQRQSQPRCVAIRGGLSAACRRTYDGTAAFAGIGLAASRREWGLPRSCKALLVPIASHWHRDGGHVLRGGCAGPDVLSTPADLRRICGLVREERRQSGVPKAFGILRKKLSGRDEVYMTVPADQEPLC